jgi:hypothetical protein
MILANHNVVIGSPVNYFVVAWKVGGYLTLGGAVL